MSVKKDFVFKADIQFKAESLEDAFAQLRNHFDACLDGTDGPAWFEGQFDIHPGEKESAD